MDRMLLFVVVVALCNVCESIAENVQTLKHLLCSQTG